MGPSWGNEVSEELLTLGSILVVDDEAGARREAAATLAGLGYDVAVAADAQQAFDMVDSRRFDLIITDLDMPDVDGLELLETIRTAEVDADVLIVSGKGSIGLAVLAMKMGAANFMEKPLTEEKLTAEVRRIFRSRREGSDPGAGSNPRPSAKPPSSLHDIHAQLEAGSSLPEPTVGRYIIRGTLGVGGMATVYDAFDPLLDRPVALKTWHAHQAKDFGSRKVFIERFRREAQAAAMLTHPNIVAVHDFGEDTEREALYLAMELVEGPTVLELVAEHGAVAVPRAVNLAFQIADALEAAHSHGIVHRDVKPANIIVQAGDQAKVLDFGVARLRNSELTESGVICGSVAYVAPEILRGDATDHTADQFSLGILLFEMITGRRLFSGSEFAPIAQAILDSTPPKLADAGVDAPADLQAILDRLLRQDPTGRYPDESELLDVLARVGSGLGMVLQLATPRPTTSPADRGAR